ncbi:MAG: MmgE/PrpD family protein [Lachnospiraceae bacterium]|nr:MmgE/PrpD family protein [Lachnospiraceae bacterium]
MEFQTTYQLEEYVLNTRWEDLPASVQERAVVCGIDLMMALVLGSRGEQFQNGRRMAKWMQPGNLLIPGCDDRFSFLGAATALGHASNSFDIDDGHNMIKGHPGTSFIGGVMAAGLEKDISYREFLTALVVSYDVAVRMGLAMQDHYQFLHSTGAYGAVATAAGAGRILGLTREQLNTAISMAEFHAPMTPVMRAVAYPSMNKDGVPFGAMIGALAVLDTLAGETAKTHLLELDEYRDLVASLGKTYEIMNLYFKPYTCCRWAHQPIQASVELMAAQHLTYEDVASVTVHTFHSAAQLSKIVPKDTDEAQYNIAYPVAAAIIHGDVGFCQICNNALDDQRVLEMMKHLSFTVDPELDRQFPEKRLAWVEFILKDGRILRSKVYAADGEASDNVDRNWILRKFHRITAPFLSPQDQQLMLELLTTDPDRKLRDIVIDINHILKGHAAEL